MFKNNVSTVENMCRNTPKGCCKLTYTYLHFHSKTCLCLNFKFSMPVSRSLLARQLNKDNMTQVNKTYGLLLKIQLIEYGKK